MFAGNFVIVGWAACDGRLLPIAQYSALLSILGTTYGGDGVTTFAPPKLENVGASRYLIAAQGVNPTRND